MHESHVEVRVGELLATLFKRAGGGPTTEEGEAGATIVDCKSCFNRAVSGLLGTRFLILKPLQKTKLLHLADGVMEGCFDLKYSDPNCQ